MPIHLHKLIWTKANDCEFNPKSIWIFRKMMCVCFLFAVSESNKKKSKLIYCWMNWDGAQPKRTEGNDIGTDKDQFFLLCIHFRIGQSSSASCCENPTFRYANGGMRTASLHNRKLVYELQTLYIVKHERNSPDLYFNLSEIHVQHELVPRLPMYSKTTVRLTSKSSISITFDGPWTANDFLWGFVSWRKFMLRICGRDHKF